MGAGVEGTPGVTVPLGAGVVGATGVAVPTGAGVVGATGAVVTGAVGSSVGVGVGDPPVVVVISAKSM